MLPVAGIAAGMSAASMGGAGIGAGAAAAGMGAAIGAALFNPVTIGLGVAMAGLAIYQSKQQNKAIKAQFRIAKQSAQNQFEALNENIKQIRRAYADQSTIATQGARYNLGGILNSIGVSGDSVNMLVGQTEADAQLDQHARRTQRDDQVKNIGYQKEQVASQARAGMQAAAAQGQPVGIAAITGGLQGMQMGMALSSTIQAYQSSARLSEAYASVIPAANRGDPVALAKVQALNAGINPLLVNESSVIQPFMIGNQLNGLQLQSARDTAAFASQRLQMMSGARSLMQVDGMIQTMRNRRGY